ncbi:hypothetical protein KR100_08265 [Synechococcus sp. KORDI-100]|nr:hypothetical protein KR100_08265 [Synechococcus sp. KORDI-100]
MILLVWKDFGGLTVQMPFRQQISICTFSIRLMELSLELVVQSSLAINGESEVQESTPARLVAARAVLDSPFFIVVAVASRAVHSWLGLVSKPVLASV